MQARGGADDSRTGNVEALEGPFPAVKLRGLPFSASQDEIRQFLVRLGLKLALSTFSCLVEVFWALSVATPG